MRTRPGAARGGASARGSRGLGSGAREPAQVVGEAVAVDLLEQRQQLAAQLAARRPLRRRVLEVRHAVRVRITARGEEKGKNPGDGAQTAVAGNPSLTTRELSQKLNRGEVDIKEVNTKNQDHYLEGASLRSDDVVRRHRDGSFEI